MPGAIVYKGRLLRHPISGRLLRAPGGNLVAPPLPSPPQPAPVVYPTTPHLRLHTPHGFVKIISQDGTNAVVRLRTPMYPYSELFKLSIHNTTATPSSSPYWANQYGGLFQGWSGQIGITRELTSLDWGTRPQEIFQELNNGTFLKLNLRIEIADTWYDPIKPAVAPIYPRDVPLIEDFLPGTGPGALYHTFGNPQNDGNSVLVLDGARTAMMPPHPQGLNTAQYGLPEGLFEFKCRFEGGRGDGTGPALVLWPADDGYPRIDETRLGEIDLGEFWFTRNSLGFWEMYMAFHWRTAAGANDDDLYNIVAESEAPLQRHNPEEWNIYGADLFHDHVDLYINGKRIVRYTARGAPDWTRVAPDGSRGVNHTLGIMNASNNTKLLCDWARWYPRHMVTAGFPGTVPYTLPIPAPSLPLEPAEPDPTPTPTPTPTPPATGTAAEVLEAQTFVSGLSMGLNIERGRAWYMLYNGQSIGASTAYWVYLKNLGFTHVRFFYPYRPTVNMEGGVWGTVRPTAAQIDRLINACVQAVNAGLKVFVDALDVIGLEDLTAQYIGLINAHVDLFCDRIAARPELTPAKICVGPINELAGGTNAQYNTYRLQLDTRVANKLPNHVRVTGAAGWHGKESLVATDWAKPTANQRWIGQFHAYHMSEGTQAFWETWAPRFASFSQRMGGNPVVAGEAGLWDANEGSYRQTEWLAAIRAYGRGVPLTRPMYWCITDSGNTAGFMLNKAGNDASLRDALLPGFADANTAIRNTAGFIAGSQTPTTPSTGATYPGEPDWLGAVQEFYHAFPGTTLDRNVWPIIYGGQGNGGVFDWDATSLIVNNGLTIETKFVNNRWKTGGISMGNLVYPGYAGFGPGNQVSFRARVDAGKGYGIGLILWPADDVWDQEIDVAESPDADKQRVWMTVHGNPPASVQDSRPHAVDMRLWNIYTVRWEAAAITFYINGAVARVVNGTQYMPKKNMTIGIQGWVFGPNDGWSGGGPDTSVTKRIQISHVRRIRKA